MNSIRTFVAIELSNNTQSALAHLQSRLKTISPPHSVRWTAPQNIHLTLHFLGDVDLDKIDAIIEVLNQVAARQPPFSLRVGGLGCFPNTKRPRVIWVGLLEKNSQLIDLHHELGKYLSQAIDFSPDTRPYAPHLTLGRIKKGIPSRQLKQLSEVLEKERGAVGHLATLKVNAVKLIKSELKPTGAVYTVLGEGNLSGAG